MKFDRVFGNIQALGVISVHKPFGKQLQNLYLTWCQFRNQLVAGVWLGERRPVKNQKPRRHSPDRVKDLLGRSIAVEDCASFYTNHLAECPAVVHRAEDNERDFLQKFQKPVSCDAGFSSCLLYTSDAADERSS